MKTIFNIPLLFLLLFVANHMVAQSTISQQHMLQQPTHYKLKPGSVTPWQAHHRGHGNMKSLGTVVDVLDYSTYNELVAANLQIAYNGSWNSPTPQVLGAELTTFVDTATASNGDVSFAQVAFDSLAFASFTNSTMYSLPLTGSTITLDSLGLFMGLWGDTVVADGTMANDSLLISIYRVVGGAVSSTPVETIVNSGYAGLSQFYTGGSGYMKFIQIPVIYTFNTGEGFAVKLTYLNKDTSSHFILSYSFADSCGTIVYQNTTYESPAYPSPFAGSSSFGQIDTSAVVLMTNQNKFNVPGISGNCSYVYEQNWEILASVSVNVPYSCQVQANTTSACNGSTVNLTGMVFGTDSPGISYSWSASAGGVITGGNSSAASVTVPSNITSNVTVTLTVNNGNSNVSDSIVIINCHVNVNAGSNQTVCSGSNIILAPAATGGTPPYSYQWQASAGSLSCTNCANPSATVSQNTVYTVTVTDAVGATASSSVSYNVNANTNNMQLSVTNTLISCASQIDTTTVTVTGGTSPYTFTWGDGSSSSSASSPVTHNYSLPGGSEIISVTDANNCVSDLLDTVAYQGPTISLANAVEPGCPNSTNGSITVSVTGGTSPYSYAWNSQGNSDTATNLSAGYYVLTVTDASTCSAIFGYSLNSAEDYNYYVFINTTGANCSQGGIISTSVTGGFAPYTYSWANGATTSGIQTSVPGYYEVTITDSLGCQTYGYAYMPTTCQSVINGTAFDDSLGNCLPAGNPGVANLYVTATASNGDVFYGFSDANGNYSIDVTDTGLFTLTAFNYWSSNCANFTFCGNSNQTVYLPVIGDTSNNNNIGLVAANGFNLGIHPGWSSANPGFIKEYWVYYYNSSQTAYNGPATITLNYDPNLTYLYTDKTPAPNVNTAAHTLTWSVSSVPSLFNNDWLQLDGYFQVPATLSLSYQLQSTFTITPMVGDCDTSDNQYSYSETVTGSHDPNEKTVSPSGPVTEADSVLTYTIHFQNTGTDSTHFVVIKDTLSPNLDPTTVRNIASSDKYSSFNVSGRGILTWTFNPLRVVDSMTNPSGSKRFIMFTVKKKAGLPIGTIISNTASVYFDYNAAVVTNTVSDTAALPTYIFEVTNNTNVSVKAFPNPFNDVTHIVVTGLNEKFGFELYDVTGRLEQSMPSVDNNQFDIHRGQLANGVYLYRILVTGKPAAYGKLVVE